MIPSFVAPLADVGPKAILLAHEQACDEVPPGYAEWARANAQALFLPYPWQHELLHDPSPITLVHTAAQMGKTEILNLDLRLYLEGTHPCQTHRPPLVILSAGHQWSQMITQLQTMWRYLDPRWFKARLDLTSGAVSGQRNTGLLDVIAGPSKGSQIRLCTYEQGPTAIQGWRVHRAYGDEPPDQGFYGEMVSRVVSQRGCVRLGFTPRIRSVGMKGDKINWLWALCDSGTIHLIHAPLTPPNVTPCQGLIRFPRFSQHDIDLYAAGLPAVERDMVLGLSRHPCFEGRVLSAFGRHLVKSLPIPQARLGIGMDHGSRPGKQCVALGWATGEYLDTHVHILRSWHGEGRTDEHQVAAAIFNMLDSIGHSIADVDYWVGDRAHGGDERGGKQSNGRIMRAIAMRLGIDATGRISTWKKHLPRPLRYIWVPHKWDGSVWDNCEIMGSMMVSERWTVDPSCTHLIEGIENWRGSYTDDWKDPVDAARYLTIGIQDDDVIRRWKQAA